jgi:hypothetical protein
LPASASADASDHRHFSPVRPSLPWDHLSQSSGVGCKRKRHGRDGTLKYLPSLISAFFCEG